MDNEQQPEVQKPTARDMKWAEGKLDELLEDAFDLSDEVFMWAFEFGWIK